MINRAVLTGRLTHDPELKSTRSGISIAVFTLAVNRQYTDASGNRGTDFISCVIWRKAAENFCNFTSKGSLVGIDGRIQTRTYDDKGGKHVYVTEVVVDSFSLLESRKEREAGNTNNGGNYNSNSGYSNNVGGNYNAAAAGSNGNTQQDPFSSPGNTVDISDDDLPF